MFAWARTRLRGGGFVGSPEPRGRNMMAASSRPRFAREFRGGIRYEMEMCDVVCDGDSRPHGRQLSAGGRAPAGATADFDGQAKSAAGHASPAADSQPD